MPSLSPLRASLRPSVFADLQAQIDAFAARGGDLISLHLGDTYLEPPQVALLGPSGRAPWRRHGALPLRKCERPDVPPGRDRPGPGAPWANVPHRVRREKRPARCGGDARALLRCGGDPFPRRRRPPRVSVLAARPRDPRRRRGQPRGGAVHVVAPLRPHARRRHAPSDRAHVRHEGRLSHLAEQPRRQDALPGSPRERRQARDRARPVGLRRRGVR